MPPRFAESPLACRLAARDEAQVSGEGARRLETFNPVQLGDEDHGDDGVDAAEAAEPRDMFAIERKLGRFLELCIHRAKTTFGLVDREHVLRHDGAVGLVLEGNRLQPATVGLTPESARRVEDETAPNEHLDESMTAASEVGADILTTATEVANGFLLRARW